MTKKKTKISEEDMKPLSLNIRLDLRVEKMEGVIYQDRLAEACLAFVRHLGVTGGTLHTDRFSKPIEAPPLTDDAPMKDPALLSHEELAEMVGNLQSILWGEGDPDLEWDSETIDAVAAVLHDAGLAPKPSDK